MNTNHTQTPWEIHPGSPSVVRDTDGNIVAEGCGNKDADFIVRAVNAHDELLAALIGMVKTVQYYADQPAHVPFTEMAFNEMSDVMKDARAAIAKSKGEKV